MAFWNHGEKEIRKMKNLHWAVYDERNCSLLNINGVCMGNCIKMKEYPATEAYVRVRENFKESDFRYLGVFATMGEAKREIERHYL
jgi:hypothetical protein